MPARKQKDQDLITLVRRVEEQPLRMLALDDWGTADITPSEYLALRRIVICDGFPPCASAIGTMISLSCHLLFALVESGGACGSSPENTIERMRIDTEAALRGYVRLPERVSRVYRKEADSEANPVVKAAKSTAGPRQHLHSAGRAHLLAFIYQRMKKDGARQGDPLLPPLPLTSKALRSVLGRDHAWLVEDLTGKVSWRRVFGRWLRHQVSILRGEAVKVSWRSVRTHALWDLLRRERRPLFIAARQTLLQTAPMPDAKINIHCDYGEPRYGKTEKTLLDSNKLTIPDSAGERGHLLAERDEKTSALDDALLTPLVEAATTPAELATEKRMDDRSGYASNADYVVVRELLMMLRAEGIKKAEFVRAARALAGGSTANKLGVPVDHDLRHLLRWIAALLSGTKKKAFTTAQSYGALALRALHEIAPKRFTHVTTLDIGEYIDNTCDNPNTVRATRNALRRFHEFLVINGLAEEGRVHWQDARLLAYEQFRERDCLTEAEYARVRSTLNASDISKADKLRAAVLLTMLRRCGLRTVEASHLRVRDIHGVVERRLEVTRSKSRAGRRRLLPLYLLLDDAELGELDDFVVSRREHGGAEAYLFVDTAGVRSPSADLGREAERYLRAGGVEGETAHGLRHAFASALFAGWWLNEVADRSTTSGGWARRALRAYCRLDVESRAVTHAYHIQLLLGHADLRVTFDRYIHVLDLAVADAVWMHEHRSDAPRIVLTAAAQLAGMQLKQLRYELHLTGSSITEIPMNDLENLLRERLVRLADQR